MPPLPTDTQFSIPDRYQPMVLSDISEGDPLKRILILGNGHLLNGLSRASVWIADGTFKKCPQLFYQLYTIHFEFGAGINPVGVYCLLPDKSGPTYVRLINALKTLIPNCNPTVILTDFEMAAMQAFQASFPDSQVTGCYFHLCQAVIRKVKEVGLGSEYEQMDEIRSMIRCLPALAHVPVDEVEETFLELADAMPIHEHMDEVISYFEHTFIRGRRLPGRGEHYRPALFPPQTWNKRDHALDGIARTTNVSEGWHNALQAIFLSNHPSMWYFFDGLLKDMGLQTASFLQGVSGSQRPAKKAYIKLRERVQRAVDSYGRSDRVTFLRAITHLSHS